MCPHDGRLVSRTTVLRLLREQGLLRPGTCQSERRRLAARGKAAFADEPTGPNLVWQLDFSPIPSPPTLPRPTARHQLDAEQPGSRPA